MQKKCTKCKQEKNISEFSLQRNGVYRSRCNICKNKDNRLYAIKNKDKIKQSKKNWREKNNNYHKIYYENNRDEIKNYFSEYYLKNKEEILKNSKEYYDNNKEHVLLRNKNHYEDNKEIYKNRYIGYYLQKKQKHSHRFAWRVTLKNVIRRMNGEKSDSTINLLGYSADDLKNHMESLFSNGMSWNNWGEWHIHHVKFISHFSNNEPPIVVNSLSNLIPLWKKQHKKIHNNEH